MARTALAGVTLALLLAATGAAAQSSLPDTPAGRTASAWLTAFDSGDRAQIDSYVKTIDPRESVDGMMGFRTQTGGFDLVSVESSEPLHLRFRVKEHNSDTVAIANLLVKDGAPPTVVSFGLRALPPGAEPMQIILDAGMRRRVIDGINSDLALYYVDPLLAEKMEASVLARMKAGDYDAITDGDAFAQKLTEDYRAVSHDKHLRVDFNPFKVQQRAEPTAEDQARFRQQMLHDNCGFEDVKVLPNNIGYIEFNGFMDAGVCGATVNAAMGFVAHTDALIFDIRHNGGGQPAMVTLIASYLFDKPTHLIDIYNRRDESTTQNWTLSYLPGPRLTAQPVYVLTSSRTFSGAEEFAFDLKNQKRAIIVGETTGGGAHPVSGHTVGDYFVVGVPFAKSMDPVTKTNWEGTGVAPDVKVPADDALATAEKLAAEQIAATRDRKAPPAMHAGAK